MDVARHGFGTISSREGTCQARVLLVARGSWLAYKSTLADVRAQRIQLGSQIQRGQVCFERGRVKT